MVLSSTVPITPTLSGACSINGCRPGDRPPASGGGVPRGSRFHGFVDLRLRRRRVRRLEFDCCATIDSANSLSSFASTIR
jgi:hypothetical protein